MDDPRETILARIETLCHVAGIMTVERNKTEFDDWQLPAISVLEGDETADDNDANRGRPSSRQYLVAMEPIIFIRDRENDSNIGTKLNAFRGLVIDALLNDATLNALTVNARMVRYVGHETTLHPGRSMIGALALKFQLTYRLLPTQS